MGSRLLNEKRVVLLVVWVLAAAYLLACLNRGWVAHDEGTLGQAAERVLHGELPNRDFLDAYTGGLAYIDAFIFKIFGINLYFLRLFLLAIFLLWVPALYSIALKFLSPLGAGATTLVAVAWSVPNYPAAMPSWFCLFLATFGTLALANYAERQSPRWLVFAGLTAGVSFLFKVVALYFVAAALLFFVFREQCLSLGECESPRNSAIYRVFVIACLLLFVLFLVKLVFPVAGFPEYLHFVFPGFCISALFALRERLPSKLSNLPRFVSLAKMVFPFLVSAALPVLLFAAFYWQHDAIDSLRRALFVAPMQRLLFARSAPFGLVLELPSILALLWFTFLLKLKGNRQTGFSIGILVVGIFLVLLGTATYRLLCLLILAAVMGLIPLIVPVTTRGLLFGRAPGTGSAGGSDQMLALLLVVTSLFSLIMFPFAQPVYFIYVAPLLTLLVANLLSRVQISRTAVASLAFFLIFFAVVFLRANLMHPDDFSDYAGAPLALPRVGPLRVYQSDAAKYGELVPLVKQLAGGHPIFAGPDCPEVYFLTETQNPTPFLFDFLYDPATYESQIASLIDRPGSIKVLVLNQSPQFSAEQFRILHALAEQRFTNFKEVGNFKVYWRP